MKHHTEREVELTYTVTVKTYGKLPEARNRVGRRLSRVCGLEFLDSEVTSASGNRKYEWDVTDHAGGTPEDFVDE